ncbi:MAG: response regulator [Nitrospira sp.]|nr:response regulator [Nitrospira sp.]MBS0174493.1 response regulator [Nitrospira sp.]MBS0177670.1 response regulator [Nitrospira sp.]MBX3336847.1 response regulator [Nitrospira sp.]MCW5779415.1 response regulator [Nitrospira sp.]
MSAPRFSELNHTGRHPTLRGLSRLLSHSRVRVMFLQSLVAGILSYELLVSNETIYGQIVSRMVALGLILISVGIMLLPKSALESAWFPGALISINTLLVTGTIYLSGNASSELYLTYFLLLLIASSAPSLKQLLGLSVIICAGYGVLVYEHAMQSGTLEVGHLLGIPVLLIMSVFYGLTLETVAAERRRNRLLREDVEELKQSEQNLEERRTQLETRVQGLKQGLSRANQEIRQGKVERTGLERQLREAQKFEAVGRLASRLAHEFNQMLAVIGAQTGAIVSKLKPDDPLHAPVDAIFRSGERAATLTAQLLALGIHETTIRDTLSLGEAIASMRETLQGLLPGRIDVRVPDESKPVLVEIGHDRLEYLLLHLIANARDAMPKGGRVDIAVEVVSGELLPAEQLEKNPRKRMARIAVSDSGGGMNSDVQAQMFEPFFSTKETHAGLGLTLVYGIVRQYGGTVEVQSQPGQGTTVRLYLPLVERNGVVRDTRVRREAVSKGAETVLVVEEDEIARKLALSTLHSHRYQVLEAGSAVEALLVAQQHKGPIHLTVSHLTLAEIGGRELAKRLVLQHPAMKALFVSGFSDDTIVSHRVNKKYFLQQPYRQHDLAEKVRELLDA